MGLHVDSGMEFGTGMVMLSSGCGVIYLFEFIKIHNRTDLQVWRLLQTYTLQRASKNVPGKAGYSCKRKSLHTKVSCNGSVIT